ncbi:76b4bc6e-e432-45f7-8701-c5452bd7b81d-CDS [Sclerotinia trifoliorum]|uniref:76b4bc6e-e432-45f7-8701-c5452bd7b81d-CDS n=1 Tax=Sclerotinia trifoliorum TaxID=28548 RepID=A0A8H2VPI1_9HELO|nr:76b4bc6e-e432-45f7-8701-c5452bd7b81d-CDS [Sclerotinia trifoliorum]
MSAFPPHKSIPSIPVNQTIALKYLQDYLSLTSSTPYLLPNAKLEPTGPTIGSSHSSVTIHNLQRVEAGLRGEWLAPTLELEEENVVEIAYGMDDGTVQGSGEGDKMDVDGWQDKEEFEREQSIEEGDGGSGVQKVKNRDVDSDLDDEPRTKEVPDFTKAPKELSRKEKDARKVEKRARHKAELKAKEVKKQSKA